MGGGGAHIYKIVTKGVPGASQTPPDGPFLSVPRGILFVSLIETFDHFSVLFHSNWAP